MRSAHGPKEFSWFSTPLNGFDELVSVIDNPFSVFEEHTSAFDFPISVFGPEIFDCHQSNHLSICVINKGQQC